MIKHKYRAWNVEEKIMHDVAFPSWNGVMEVWQDNKPQSKIQYLSMAGTEEEGVLEQYIGLKDCKRTKEYPEGQEIYEGDIIRFTFECDIETHILTGLVEYNNDGYFQVVSKCFSTAIFDHLDEIEVIGNVHENPEYDRMKDK